MGSSIKRVIRDRLVNDGTIRSLLTNVTTTSTASLFITPVYMELTGRYPHITYSETPGNSDPGMSAVNGMFSFMIETQATGGANPHLAQEALAERIDQLFDDQNQTGVGISGTASYAFLTLREGWTEISYSQERKTFSRFGNFSYKQLNY